MSRRSPAEIAALNAAQRNVAPVGVDALAKAIEGIEKLPGKPGAAGKDGKDGLQGPPGEFVAGPIGPPGRDGIDGLPGTNGKSITGPQGLQGEPGRDGVGPDEKVKLDAADPEAGFLEDKLEPGLGVKFRRSKTGKALVIDATGGGAGGIRVAGGGGAHPNLAAHDALGLATDDELAAHALTPHGGAGADDQTAAEVPFTPAGTIAATNVQAAIEEVAAEAGGALPADLQNIVDNWAVDTDGRALINLASSGGAAQDGVSIVADELPSDTVDLFTVRVPAVLPDTGEYQLFGVDSGGSVEIDLANANSIGVQIDESIIPAGGSFELLKITGQAGRPGKFIAQIGEGSAPVSKGFKVGGGGFIIAKHNAAPADADLEASDVGLWFDDTDGAAAPQWKGKSADGTVVSGSLDDQTAAEVPFTPAGTIAATNVQAAIEEVAAEAGAGDIEEVLTEGGDPNGVPFTGQVEIRPQPTDLYALLIQALAGFDNNYTAFVRVMDEFGNEVLNVDTGGVDSFARPGDHTHFIAREVDTGNVAELGSGTAVGLHIYEGTILGTVADVNADVGLRLQAFIPPTTTDFGTQIYYDGTNGAAYLRLRGRTADGTLVTGKVRLGATVQTYTESNVTTDRAFNANATSIDELADVLGTLIGDLRAQGVVA